MCKLYSIFLETSGTLRIPPPGGGPSIRMWPYPDRLRLQGERFPGLSSLTSSEVLSVERFMKFGRRIVCYHLSRARAIKR